MPHTDNLMPALHGQKPEGAHNVRADWSEGSIGYLAADPGEIDSKAAGAYMAMGQIIELEDLIVGNHLKEGAAVGPPYYKTNGISVFLMFEITPSKITLHGISSIMIVLLCWGLV